MPLYKFSVTFTDYVYSKSKDPVEVQNNLHDDIHKIVQGLNTETCSVATYKKALTTHAIPKEDLDVIPFSDGTVEVGDQTVDELVKEE